MSMQPQSGNPSDGMNTPDHPDRAPEALPGKEAPGDVDRKPGQAPQTVPGEPAQPGQHEPGRQPTPGEPDKVPKPVV